MWGNRTHNICIEINTRGRERYRERERERDTESDIERYEDENEEGDGGKDIWGGEKCVRKIGAE